MDRRAEYIETLIQALDRVLDALDADSQQLGSDSDPIMGACAKAFELYQAEAERLGPAQRSGELQQRIRHAVKLHALVLAGANREKERIGNSLEGSADRRQRMHAYKTLPRLGESCDMAG